MKKVIIAAAIVLGAGSTLYAQTTDSMPHPHNAPQAMPQHAMMSPDVMAKKQTEKLNSVVKLSDEQSKSIYQANLAWATKMQAAMQSKDMNARKQAQEERDAQYKKILTADQFKTLNDQKMQMMQNRANMAKPGMAPVAKPVAPATAPVK